MNSKIGKIYKLSKKMFSIYLFSNKTCNMEYCITSLSIPNTTRYKPVLILSEEKSKTASIFKVLTMDGIIGYVWDSNKFPIAFEEYTDNK